MQQYLTGMLGGAFRTQTRPRPQASPQPTRTVWVKGVATATLVTLATLAVVTAAPRPAAANGGAVEIFRAKEGRYEIIVGIQPERPVVGSVHISVTPLDASTSLVVTGAVVVIVAHDERDKPVYQARAVNVPSAPQYYDANITFETPGAWTLMLSVRSQKLGEVTVLVPLTVRERPIPPGMAGTVVLLVVVAILVGGVLYVWRSARRRPRVAGD